jgi:hypothetical protein
MCTYIYVYIFMTSPTHIHMQQSASAQPGAQPATVTLIQPQAMRKAGSHDGSSFLPSSSLPTGTGAGKKSFENWMVLRFWFSLCVGVAHAFSCIATRQQEQQRRPPSMRAPAHQTTTAPAGGM